MSNRNRTSFRLGLVVVALALSAWATHATAIAMPKAMATAISCGELAVSAWTKHGNYPPGPTPGNAVNFTDFLASPPPGSQMYIAYEPEPPYVGLRVEDIAQIHAAGKFVGVLADGGRGEAHMLDLANRGFDWIILDEITWHIWLDSGYSPATGAIAGPWFNTLRNAAKSGTNPNVKVAAVEPFWDMMNALLTNGATPDMVMGEDYYDGDGRNIRRVHLDQWQAQGYHVGQWVVGLGHISAYSGTEMIVTSDWGPPYDFVNEYEALLTYCGS